MATDGANPSANPSDAPLTGARAVDVREIEDALTQLWMSNQAGGRSGMQAYTLNLIVFAGSTVDPAEVQSIAAKIGVLHPSRTIIVQTGGSEESRLRAWISAQCDYQAGGESGGSEQIVLEAAGDGVRQVPGTVIPLLIPDVPVVLWWPGDGLFNHPIFPSLMDASDQLVIDSSAYPESLTVLSRLHSLATEEYPGVSMRDLVWARLTPWRELTAQFFDAPTTRPYLDGIHRVRVAYAQGPEDRFNPEQSLLYASWLASRLEWEAIPNLRRIGRETMLVVRSGEAPITLEFSARRATDLPPGCLLSATLEAQAGESEAEFSIRRADDREHTVATIEVVGQTPQERIVPMQEGSIADILADEVGTVRRDHVFDEALEVAVRLASPRSGGAR
jgi:glucose-6-phosphate dehydrogenase assembly protein OpcA